MNRKIALSVVLACILIFAVTTSCSAKPSRNEKRIAGSWTTLTSNLPVVIGSDGTISGFAAIRMRNESFTPDHFALARDKIFLYGTGTTVTAPAGAAADATAAPDTSTVTLGISYDFRISKDGKTLIIGNSAFKRN